MIRFFLAATLASIAVPHAISAQTQAPAPIRQFDRISVEAVGRGTPVILIPGLSMSRENWRQTADRLATRHRVYLVQIDGFGGSPAGANLTPGIMAGVVEDLHALVGREKMDAPAVVGHSLGGTLALLWGRTYPKDAGRLLIVDSLPWVGRIMAPATATPAMMEAQAKAIRDTIAASQGKPVDEAAGRAQIAMLALKPASREAAYRWSKDADRRVTAQAFYEDMMLDLRSDVAKLPMPVTLIYPWAAQGPAKDAADTLYRDAYAKVPDMTFVDVGESGHFVMLDRPAIFQAALDRFLAPK